MGAIVHVLAGASIAFALLAAPWTPQRKAETPQKQQMVQKQQVVQKLRGELGRVVASAADDALIPVTIVMRDQASRSELDRASRLRDKAVRRAEVIRILKKVADGSQPALLEVLRAGQQTGAVGSRIDTLWLHNVVAAEVTADMARRIAARGDVAYLNHNKKIADVFPVEPERREGGGPLAAIECGVDLMDADRVWNELGITGRGAVVCVIDTGCCITHPDLANQIWTNPGEIPNNGIDDDGNGFVDDIHGWNFENNNNNINDTYGHGTHVSGTVGGDGTNGQTTGMAPDVQLMICKFWNSFSGENSVWQSMQYAVANGADVTTASLGWPHSMGPDRATWRSVCENTIAAGLVVIYAAGNEDNWYGPIDNVRTPGDVPDVITVGATNCNDQLAWFSSTGPVSWEYVNPYNDWPYPPGKIKPSIAAPGEDTLSTSRNYGCTGYEYMSGTSMATPHVAGAVALLLEANPDLDHFGVKEILGSTAVDLGSSGEDNQYGMGRVDAYEAVLAALASAQKTYPDSFQVNWGNHMSGDLEDLLASDDSYVVVRGVTLASQITPPVELELTGTAAVEAPSQLRFVVEAATNAVPLLQRIQLYNYDSGQWETVGEQDSQLTDTEVTVTIDSNPGRFVQGGSLQIKARVQYWGHPLGSLTWDARFDHTYWSFSD